MKKNVIFILLLTILSSCKSEYEEYSGTDAIYLNEISDTVRFSFTYVDSEYETQAQDIHLKVIGKVADYDRPVNIKFTPVMRWKVWILNRWRKSMWLRRERFLL